MSKIADFLSVLIFGSWIALQLCVVAKLLTERLEHAQGAR
jgi:hypothetical protein